MATQAAELKSLIQKRGTQKAQVTRFSSFTGTIVNDDLTQLKVRFEKIKPAWNEFETIQSRIEDLDQDHATQHDEERGTFENAYFTAIADAERHIQRCAPAVVLPPARDTVPDSAAQVKLPTINLPSFSGAYDQWMAFKDTFQSIIHDNGSIAPIQKFHYLRSALTDEAAQVIHSLEISSLNYDIAWDLLKDRFHNERIIVQSHVKALFDFPPITRESHVALRQLLDATSRHLRALRSLKQPIESWDTILVHLISSKFDHATKREWESAIDSKQLPKFSDMKQFLDKRCHLLQSIDVAPPQLNVNRPQARNYDKHAEGKRRDRGQSYVSTNKTSCPKCGQGHLIYRCQDLTSLSVGDRIREIKRLNLCLNSLRGDHQVSQCNSGNCRVCNRKHNTMLHISSGDRAFPTHGAAPPVTSSNELQIPARCNALTHVSSIDRSEQHTEAHNSYGEEFLPAQVTGTTRTSHPITRQVRPNLEQGLVSQHAAGSADDHVIVLCTARLIVLDKHGLPQECRALLDSGSQSNFITRDLARRLNIDLQAVNIPVYGINQSTTPVTQVAKTTVKSCINNNQAHLSFLVLPTITERLPGVRLDRRQLGIPRNLKLADPFFDKPAAIDLLIGAELFWDLLCVGQVKSSLNGFIMQKTYLGWIVSGRVSQFQQQPTTAPSPCFLTVQPDLQEQLHKFWVMEETLPVQHLSPEELRCETHFVANSKRDPEGRFVVKLPLRSDPSKLGDSRTTALKRFYQLERKLKKYPELAKDYAADLNDYIVKGHMEEVPDSELDSAKRPVYYLPHHAVLKEQSTSTKLRVVFDASSPSSSGVSLNDLLMVGPTVQDDLLSIVIRFRGYRHVVTADIAKMYRQINVHPDDTDLQRILWRPSENFPIKTYRLKVVTFGTSSAPFLATRCLSQLAADETDACPMVSRAILTDFYVDDLLTGATTRAEVTMLKTQLSRVLENAGFHLHKWNSTCAELRDQTNLQPHDSSAVQLTNQTPVKTLGIYWDSTSDNFSYQLYPRASHSRCTKRQILSVIAGIFDPLCLLGPVVINAKILIQQLWQLKLGWDEAVSQDFLTKWQTFERGLSVLNDLQIPRRVISLQAPVEMHMHGFCDASEKAYGACLYICVVDHQGFRSSQLLCARSRVAPLNTISIPRLELCSALLLARLSNKVMSSLDPKPLTTTLWSDSTVALAWLSSSAHRWKTFVANRVSDIQTLTVNSDWRHVSTLENPADMLSRGCQAHQMNYKNSLWWNGPAWLCLHRQHWPKKEASQECLTDAPELRVQSTTALIVAHPRSDIFERFSSLARLVNVVAFCLRLKHNCKFPADRLSGPLQVKERVQSMCRLLHLAQRESFQQEIRRLSNRNTISSTSRILTLSPYLDEEGLVRVGGRLEKATVPEDHKHPVILPPNHPLTTLIIKNEHLKHLHAGTLGTLSAVRQRYWPLSGRRTVQGVLRTCIPCFRIKPRQETPIMGQLPVNRVTPSRPFSNCGVDFAGPFSLRQGGCRSKVRVKAYMSVFVCFATRYVHLELVSTLTSEGFIATLKRFIGRRGKPHHIFSDNGTNFTGANNELLLMRKNFYQAECQHRVTSWLAKEDIQWNFIPPASPHFGGIWEAAVKSAKRHLLPVVGNATLTFEELATLLIQVESCLNSRPLSPLSADPNDLSVLTPGHFLVGSALSAIPEPSLLDIPINRLSRWQRVQQLTQHFWSRWSKEYLSGLQQRAKWCKSTPQVMIGTLVLLRDERTPPLKWPLGRVTQVFPGRDGIVRVATVRTTAGQFKRAITKLSVLPFEPVM